MLRFFVRMLGLLTLAAGFASLVVDGTRSIAGSEISLTPLSSLFTAKLPMLQKALVAIHPMLWDPVVVAILRVPLWAALAVLGLLMLRLGRKRAPDVGYSTRS